MRYKHELNTNRIKVFLSSSMANKTYMEQRSAIIAFFERMEFYDLFAIEQQAHPDQVNDHYIQKVRDTDIMILVLQTSLRPAVMEEYRVAVDMGKPVFAFLYSGRTSQELKSLIAMVQDKYTTVQFSDTGDLIDKIEASVLGHLVSHYKTTLGMRSHDRALGQATVRGGTQEIYPGGEK